MRTKGQGGLRSSGSRRALHYWPLLLLEESIREYFVACKYIYIRQ
jgi:hypothetical protein